MKVHRLTSLVLAALVLTGCAPDVNDADASAAPSVTPSSAPVEVGDLLTHEASLQLQKDSKGQKRGYPMTDGSYVVVDRFQPLPAAVQADADAKAAKVQAASPVLTSSGNALAGIQELPGILGGQTGKRVLVVSHMSGFEYDNTPVEGWFVVGASKDIAGMRSEAPATAAAQEYINQQSDPATWVIVVAR